MEQLLERINKLAFPVKAGILAALVVGITALSYFLLIQGIEEQIDTFKSSQSALDRTLAEKKEIADNLNERRKEMDNLEQHLQDALTELPEKKDLDELLAQLNDVGKKAGLEIQKVVPGVESFEAFYARIPIVMSVQGNYHEVAIFLQEVANMRRIVNVNNIKLNVAGGQDKTKAGEKVRLSSDFMATTFRFHDPGKDAGKPGKGDKPGKSPPSKSPPPPKK